MKIAFRSFYELATALRRLRQTPQPCVTFFGSSKLAEGSEYYELARRAALELSKHGYAVMTGGGPGVMEAANRGAHEAKGRSVACGIVLPHERKPNPFLHSYYNTKYFFVR